MQQLHDLQCNCAACGGSTQQGLDELEFGRSACSLAQRGQTARLRALLGRRPELVHSDGTPGGNSGYTPLHYAARGGRLEAARLLLSRGASVDAATAAGGATALHRAAYAGHLQVTQALLAAGGDAARQDSDGQTPLHKAEAQGHSHVAGALREAAPQADVLLDRRGRTPAQLAELRKS